MQRSRKSRTRLFKTVATLFMAAGAIVSIFPFLWMISTSFKVEIDVLEFPIRLIPKTWNFDNYATVFTKSSFLLYTGTRSRLRSGRLRAACF